MKNIFCIATLVTILHANSVFAASGAEGGGIGLIGWVFIGFGALIIAFQFVPAVMMFGSMMAAIFGKAKTPEGVADDGKVKNF